MEDMPALVIRLLLSNSYFFSLDECEISARICGDVDRVFKTLQNVTDIYYRA